MTFKRCALVVLLAIILPPPMARSETALTVMTHDSFNVSKELITTFEQENHATVRFLKSGDAGAALVQAILSKGNPLADVFFGVDNTFLSRALKAGIFVRFDSPLLAAIPAELKLDTENRLLPVDFGDVCLNYDKEWFKKKGLPPPQDLADLIKPEYAGLTVVENPATSSPGLAFLLATIGRFGERDYLDFWKKLRANKVLVADGWEDAYFGHFTAASKGDRPIAVSYASSPPAAVYYAKPQPAEAPTAAVVTGNNAFRQIEFAGVMKDAKQPELARQFINFILGTRFQEDIPLQMFMFPANSRAKQPELFVKHARIAARPAFVDPAAIEKNREKWLEEWTTAVLR